MRWMVGDCRFWVPGEGRLPMELVLTDNEVLLLKEILEADRSRLLMEIANTDVRSMRSGLKEREEALRSIVKKITVVQAA